MRRALAEVARAASAAGKPFGLCGEMAGDPLAAMALLGLGYRCLVHGAARGCCPCGPRSEAWISTAYMVTGRPSNSSTDRL